jgi:hypothetical protein
MIIRQRLKQLERENFELKRANELISAPSAAAVAIAEKTGIVLLRAERAGGGNGRVYRVHFRAADGLGGACAGTVSVIVPKSMNGAVVDDGQRYDSTRR